VPTVNDHCSAAQGSTPRPLGELECTAVPPAAPTTPTTPLTPTTSLTPLPAGTTGTTAGVAARRLPPGLANAWLARVAHELRMPLHAIVGHAQALQTTSQPGTQLAMAADFICSAGNSLLGLANDLLDHCSLSSGEFLLHESEFPLARVLDEVGELAGLAARTKGLSFRCQSAGTLPALVVADEARLRQVLLNLLDNAANHTGAAGIALEVRGRMADEAACVLRFEVRDVEGGTQHESYLPPAPVPVPPHRQRVRRHGGTGLGLTISRELLQAMGSDLEVASLAGTGTCFGFSLRVPVRGTDLRGPA
jgi:signal transduction histidine kinase